ncbi:MAG: hypothetical protein KatS3mg072_1865 [Meiothermus sp.]|nr:MAG: hypothetical protein KatS3mg072_1865 [Meiothermus sp.]
MDDTPLVGGLRWVVAGALLYFLKPTYLLADPHSRNRCRTDQQRSNFKPPRFIPDSKRNYTKPKAPKVVLVES